MKETYNPDNLRLELKDAKRLYRLKKKRSPRHIEIIEDIEDPWFIIIANINNKSLKFEHCMTVVLKDLEHCVSLLQRQGWEITESNT